MSPKATIPYAETVRRLRDARRHLWRHPNTDFVKGCIRAYITSELLVHRLRKEVVGQGHARPRRNATFYLNRCRLALRFLETGHRERAIAILGKALSDT